MDGHEIDRLARLVGAEPSRRRVLKLLGGGLFGLAGGIAVRRAPTALAQGAGNFGDACASDDECDGQRLLTCDDDRSTCRGGTGYACFDSGDCSSSDGLLCLDGTGTECTGEESECGTCGTVQVPGGHATVTIHKATCPTGVGPDIFNQCHGNVLGGVSFSIDGFEIGSGVITTDANGVASQTILEAAATGDVTVTEDAGTFAGYVGAYVYCAEQNSGTVLYDGSADAGAVSFTASQGDDIVCDWYNLTSGGSTTPATGGATTLPATGAASSVDPGNTGWLGAAALGGAAAFLAGKKLRDGNRAPE